MRDDIRGITRCPQEISDFLAVYGGRNQYGEPNWRVVLAESVVWKVSGGKVWDPSLTIAERGGINFETGRQHTNKPIRDESGQILERLRYPCTKGWILQRWFSALNYSRAEWFSQENCIPGTSIPMLGPYPEEGDYEMMAGPCQHVPTKGELQTWISCYWRGINSRKSIKERIRDAHEAALREKQREAQETFAILDAFIRDECSYLKSSSLEAGRIRTERAEKLGIREHVGS